MRDDEDDRHWVAEAVRASEAAVRSRALPFAGLVVRDGRLLGSGINEVRALCDPSAHAEVQAIRSACRHLRASTLDGAVLYASGEPCAMCLVTASFAGIARVVYAADAETAARYGFAYGAARRLLSPCEEWSMPIEQIDVPGSARPFEVWQAGHR